MPQLPGSSNIMMRIGMEAFRRRANTLSKKIEIQCQTLAPYFLSQNFCRVHGIERGHLMG
jgi:hypothetical protein